MVQPNSSLLGQLVRGGLPLLCPHGEAHYALSSGVWLMHGFGIVSDWFVGNPATAAVAEANPKWRGSVDRTGEPPPGPLGLVRS